MTAHMVEIGDFVDVVSGPAFKSSGFTDDPSDVTLIKGENIAQGYIAWDKSKFWPAADAEEYERFALQPGDIVLAMDRPWVTAGLKWARLKPHDPPSLLVQRVARLRARKGLSQDFLTYVIGSADFSEYVRNIMGGTNVPHISGAQIKAFKFRKPGENEQGAIAETLSAYDGLIENNRRRIVLLEEAARMLYREWFVRFRFPGHGHVKIIDGLPDGWGRRTFDDVCDAVGGGTPSTAKPEFWNDGDIPWYTPTDITRSLCLALLDSATKITEAGLRGSSAKMLPPGTLDRFGRLKVSKRSSFRITMQYMRHFANGRVTPQIPWSMAAPAFVTFSASPS
jgi:restriction endonuclease S subunit